MTTPSGLGEVRLWDGAAPRAGGSADKDIPTLIPFLPNDGPRAAPGIIICPGGGYGFRVDDFEGTNVAAWFAARGWAAFVLKYRIPAEGYPHPVPLLDVQRAMRLVRHLAVEWNVDPARTGIIGFSAGGHLAATLATHFDAGNPAAPDPIDRFASRPDFAVLVYPVITMEIGITHPGSRDNLLGPNPTPALVGEMSLETQVTPQTPPTLVISTPADDLVPFENSQRMYDALQKAGVPSALHSYPDRPHGWGRGREPDISPPGWLDRVTDWLAGQGISAV
jgi:acetyl esterase/lipase